MAQLPLDDALNRFKDNEERLDLFINDAVGYLTHEGISVESIQAFLARLETEILGFQAEALVPRVETLESEMVAVEGRLDTLEAFTLDDRVTVLETDMVDVKRISLNPSEWVSYLPVGSDFTTPALSAGVATKILIPTTVKFSKEFAIVDIGGGDFRVQYQGPIPRSFNMRMTTSMQSSANNTQAHIQMFKGTTASPDVLEPGVSISRTIGTGADTGAFGVEGAFTVNPLDVIAIAASTSVAGTLTFIQTSIVVQEKR